MSKKIKNAARPKAKKTSGKQVSSGAKKSVRKQTKKIANDIGKAEKGEGGFGGSFGGSF